MENLEIIAFYKNCLSDTFLYKNGIKFFLKYRSVYTDSNKESVKEITVDEAKALFQKMNQRYTSQEVFGS